MRSPSERAMRGFRMRKWPFLGAAVALAIIAWPHQTRYSQPRIIGFGPISAFAQSAQAGMSPCAGGTLAATSSSSNVQLSACGPVVIIYNISSQEAFYGFGSTSSATATSQSTSTTAPVANEYSIPGNTYVVVQVPNTGAAAWYVAAVTATSTATLRIVQGYANS